MIQRIRHIRRTLAIVLLLLFGAYYANSTLFWHSHVINGVTIVHSHFHLQQHEAIPQGGHTTAQLQLIQLMNGSLLYTDTVLAFSFVLFIIHKIRNNRPTVQACCRRTIPYFSLRAPPVSVM